jgi:hypothetical protein
MSFFPQRDNTELGGAQERTMGESVDGFDTIRTAEWQNNDGTWSRLHTRNGWPLFETDKLRVSSGTSVSVRGFVAKVPGGTAVLFDPYTLAVLQSPYTPALNTYTVQDFATDWNVPSGDTTHWCDTVIFDGTAIKVNGKTLPDLGITADHGFPAIPYAINRNDASDQYGNAERNATEKRVFAVGRYSVQSWGGSGVVETLTPSAPRTDHKAMTLGQRSSSDDVAHLWQMYYSGDFWDSWTAEWYFSGASVQMLLASAYLVKTSISAVSAAHTPAAFGSPTTTSETTNPARSIPDAIMQLVGHGELEDIGGGFEVQGGVVYVRYPWDGYTTGPVVAYEKRDSVGTSYLGTSSSTTTIADKIISVNCSNSAFFESITGDVHYADQFTSQTPHADIQIIIYFNGTTSVPIDHSVRQPSSYGVYATTSPVFYWTAETNEVLFSATLDTTDLIVGRIYRRRETGNDVDVQQYNWAAANLAFPRGGWGTGYGYNMSGQGIRFDPYSDWPIDPVLRAPGAARARDIVATYVGDETRSTLDDYYLYLGRVRHTFTLTGRSAPDTQVITWSTTDYLLYDELNGVYVTVEGNFAGAGSSASLTVNLRVKTRHSDTVQTLYLFSWTYAELVRLKEIGSTGKYAIPSPQIRSIFAPLYQEQGSFKGAHYVTLDEEANGAAPFHGFSFLLQLRTYVDFTTVNEDNDTGASVYFVPCNLLEMLYCFVFSQDYGVSSDGARYRVTSSVRYDDVIANLFNVVFRVSVRDGSAVNWTDSLGADFAAVSTVSLHRT